MDKLTLGMSNLKFSLSETHPNKMIIEGCITKIAQASTAAPCGSDGKKIVFTKEAIDKCYKTYEMMPVNCTFPADFDWSPGTEVLTGHGSTNIGVMEKVWPEGEDLMAKVVVWKALFPDISFMTVNAKDSLGFSIECYPDKTHESPEDGFMYIDEFTGLGCAMLFKNTAAFSGTYIRELVASLNKPKVKVEDNMNEEQMKALLAGLLDNFKTELKASVESMESKVDTMITEVKAEVDKANKQVEDLAVSLAETKEELKATKVEPVIEPVVVAAAAVVQPPAPAVLAAGQVVVPNGDFAKPEDDFEKKLQEINASTMTPLDKCKAITRLRAAQQK